MFWLLIASIATATGVVIETWISGLDLGPTGRGDPDALRIVPSNRGLVASVGCGGMRLFRTAMPSEAGFFRRILGRGEDPCVGAVVLLLGVWV